MTHIKGSHTAQNVGELIAQCLRPFFGNGVTPFSGVLDGGDIASVRYTAQYYHSYCLSKFFRALQCQIEDRRCLCHLLNNMIKKIIEKPLDGNYLKEWRSFVGHIHSSNPFKELWDKCCNLVYQSKKPLQPDCPTRFTSTVTMLQQAVTVKEAVEEMWEITARKPDEWDKHHVCI